MDEFIQKLVSDPWGRLALQYLSAGGLKGGFLFVLVVARLAGVLLIAPCFLSTMIPLFVRTGLVVFLSLVIAPALSGKALEDSAVSQVAYQTVIEGQLPLTELGSLLMSELSLGAVFGIGIITVLSGIRLGGEWLERQTGLSVGSLMNPDGGEDQTGASSLVHLLGIAIFLAIKPLGGTLLLMQSVLQSFQEIPVGSAAWQMSLRQLIGEILQQSFVLGLRIAMPTIAAMTLVDIGLAFVGRSSPLPMSGFSFVIRISLSMIIFALTITVLPEVVLSASSVLFESLRGVR